MGVDAMHVWIMDMQSIDTNVQSIDMDMQSIDMDMDMDMDIVSLEERVRHPLTLTFYILSFYPLVSFVLYCRFG